MAGWALTDESVLWNVVDVPLAVVTVEDCVAHPAVEILDRSEDRERLVLVGEFVDRFFGDLWVAAPE